MSGQQNWQISREQPKRTKGNRLVYGILLLLLAAAGILAVVLTITPTSPELFVRSYRVDTYGSFDKQSLYVKNDVDRLDKLFVRSFSEDAKSIPAKTFVAAGFGSDTALTGSNFGQLIDKQLNVRADDVVIIHLAAHGVCDASGRIPMLQTDVAGDQQQAIESLLQSLTEKIKSNQKIVLLDAGQIHNDYQAGFISNPFPLALHHLMKEKIDDENLWVIISHGLFQTSQISELNDSSYFANAISATLARLRDEGDPVTIEKLYQGIYQHCAASTRKGDNAQTPLLMRGQHGIILDADRADHFTGLKEILMQTSQIQSASEDELASTRADASEKPDDAQDKTQGESQNNGGDENAADPATDKTTKVVAEEEKFEFRFERAWRLRDQLQGRQHRFSPVDFAPNLWYRINEKLIVLERHERRDVVSPNTLISDADVQRLQDIADAMDRSPPQKVQSARNQTSNEFQRLGDSWNDFLDDNRSVYEFVDEKSAASKLIQYTLLYRDIAFRSRYYVNWFDQASQVDELRLKDEIESLLSKIDQYKNLFSQTRFQGRLGFLSNEAAKRETAIVDLVDQEKMILAKMRSRIGGIDTNLTDSVKHFAAERLLVGLLESPLLGLETFFGYARPGFTKLVNNLDFPNDSEQIDLLSRSTIETALSRLVKRQTISRDQTDVPEWPTAPWFGDIARHRSTILHRIDLHRKYFSIIGKSISSPSVSDVVTGRLNDGWEERVFAFFSSVNRNRDADNGDPDSDQRPGSGFGDQIRLALRETVSKSPNDWFDTIVIPQRQLRQIVNDLNDKHFLAPGLVVRLDAEPIVVQQIQRLDRDNIIDFDSVASRTRRFSIDSENAQPNRSVKLKLMATPSALADAISAQLIRGVDEEKEIINPDRTFSVGVSGEFAIQFNVGNVELAEDGKIWLQFADPKLQADGVTIDQFGVDQEVIFGVELPKPNQVFLIVQPSGSNRAAQVVAADQVLELQPFANRNQSFELNLRNDSGREKSIDVQLFPVLIPEKLIKNYLFGEIPRDENDVRIHPDVRSVTLASANANPPLAVSTQRIVLQPRNRTQDHIKLTVPQPEPPPDAAATPQATETAGPDLSATNFSLNQGFLVRLIEEDVEFDETGTRDFWIQLAPPNTARMIDETAEFYPNGDRKRLSIRLELNEQTPIPDELDIRIQTNLPADQFTLSHPDGIILNGLDKKKRTTSVSIDQQAFQQGSKPIHVFVNVNEESGVFIYELGPNNLGTDNVVEDSHNQIDILDFVNAKVRKSVDGKIVEEVIDPSPEVIALTPPKEISFEFLVNFSNQDFRRKTLEVQFSHEDDTPSPRKRKTDHQISFEGSVNEESGLLQLTTGIQNHVFTFPAGAERWDLEAKIPGRNDVISKTSQKFLFDKFAPTSATMEFPGGTPELDANVGETVTVGVRGKDNVGIKSIELFLDKNENGEIDEGDPLIDSKSKQSSVLFELPTEKLFEKEKLKLGENYLVARIMDELGNSTPDQDPVGSLEVILTLFPKPPVKPKNGKPKNRFTVKVKVVWTNAVGQVPLPKDRIGMINLVSLEPKKGKNFKFATAKNNFFTFDNITNGKYLVSGSGTSTGRPSREIQGFHLFEVKDADLKEVLLELKIGGKLKPDKDDEKDN